MFGMGTELSRKDFGQVMRMAKCIIVGIVCHYTIMLLVGFVVAHLFNFPDEIAAGIILIGCRPNGLVEINEEGMEKYAIQGMPFFE